MTKKDLFSSPEEEPLPDIAAVPEISDAQSAVAPEEFFHDGQISLFEENAPQEDLQLTLEEDSPAEERGIDSFAISAEQQVAEKPSEVPELVISSVNPPEKETVVSAPLSFLDDFDEESFYTPVDQIPRRRRFKNEELSEVSHVFEEKNQEDFSENALDEGFLLSEEPKGYEEIPEEELIVQQETIETFESAQAILPLDSADAVAESSSEEILPAAKKKSGKKPGSAVSPLVEIVEIVVGALVASILVLTLICRTGVVEGGSMLPTMHSGDRYIISDLFYTPEAGDIVVFRPEIEGEDELWIKRVIAVEGQTVYIDPDTYRVYVDNQLLDEPYLNGMGTIPHTTQNPITVPEGCVFVMGDNRAISHDSRYEDLGCVEVRQLAGRVILRFWPLNSFGFCE